MILFQRNNEDMQEYQKCFPVFSVGAWYQQRGEVF